MLKKKPGEAEMEILETVERIGPATVRKILEAMPPERKLAHTTVITVLQRLEGKGLVKHKKSKNSKAFVFSVAGSMKTIRQSLVKNFVQTYFGNDPVPMVASLLEARGLTDEELIRLREMLSIDPTDS